MRSLISIALKPEPATPILRVGPFDSLIQRRWKKPADTARTRLENRTRDLKLDKLMLIKRKLDIAFHLFDLMSRRRGHYVSLQIMARWATRVGLNIDVSEFIKKYLHLFEVFMHPVRRNRCCRVTSKMMGLVDEEMGVIRDCEMESVARVKKLLMMSRTGTLHMHALGLAKRELGLPDDFRDSLLRKCTSDFRVVDTEIVGLVDRDESLAVAKVEEWREREYAEKWLSELETKYAFPVNFPTGFKIEKGFRETLKKWQRMPYIKPYEKEASGAIQLFEKRVVGILHEFLSLTIEKMIEVDKLVHFRKDLGMVVNFRELLLKHPGIFYISTKGPNQTVFLREAYSKGCLVEPNPIYTVRKKMQDLLLLGCRNRRELESCVATDEGRELSDHEREDLSMGDDADGYWVIPLLESSCSELEQEEPDDFDQKEGTD
ncbi:hypothetical protein Droror1_Dr00002087 [Drosera rotundifolia]